MPPVIKIVSPVMWFELSDAKNNTVFAISAGSAALFNGVFFIASSITFCGVFFIISVLTRPGATALTLILKLLNSFDKTSLNDIKAALLGA